METPVRWSLKVSRETDEALREQLVARGRVRAGVFTWPAHVSGVLAMYRRAAVAS